VKRAYGSVTQDATVRSSKISQKILATKIPQEALCRLRRMTPILSYRQGVRLYKGHLWLAGSAHFNDRLITGPMPCASPREEADFTCNVRRASLHLSAIALGVRLQRLPATKEGR
jgi:hypothetical protein